MSSNLFIINSNHIFKDVHTEIIIYQDILLINPEEINCKIIGNIINIKKNGVYINSCKDLTDYTKIFFLGIDFDIQSSNPFLQDLCKVYPDKFSALHIKNNIGIITPSYNPNKHFYKRHLLSISKQKLKDYIHITVDNYSDNDSFEIWKTYSSLSNSVYISHKSKIVEAIKTGYFLINKSTKYWSWLNTDDEYYDENVLGIIDNIKGVENKSIYFGNGIMNKLNKERKNCYILKNLERTPKALLLNGLGILQPSTFLKSNDNKIEKQLEDLDESLAFDHELWIKCAFALVGFKHLDYNLSIFNFYEDNITSSKRKEQIKQSCNIVKKYYGFTPLTWIKRYNDILFDINNDGIWKCGKSKKNELIDYFNNDDLKNKENEILSLHNRHIAPYIKIQLNKVLTLKN